MSKHVPEGWQVKTLEEVSALQRGFDLPAQDRNRGTFPVIASNGIVGYHDEFKIKAPCVVTGRSGSIGKVIYCEEDIWPLNTTLYVKDFHGNDPKYVYYFLNFFDLEKYGSGTGVPTLNRNDVHSEVIQVPPLTEQRKIADVLSSADRSIAATENLIAKLGDLKKALMQQLLTQGIGHTEFKPSPLGPIPKSWEVVRLEDVTLMKSGEGITSKSIQDKGVYHVYGGNGLRGFTKTFTHTGEYVLIGRQGALCGNITRVGGKFYASEHAVVVTVKEQAYVDWIFYKLGYMNLNQYSEASAQPGLSVEKIMRIKMALPPVGEQRKIADILNGVDRKLSAAKIKLTKCKDLKQGLMNDLLSGKKRVN